ncbi:hypothetical protein WR25_09632 [Diploscapter pachys]|uniref:Uncharacterized protein n=1 Tax=Diploscapter pachys TaxID=2018661 RepID=A0A2A2J5F2_9BILA|nr:hypothetical protein WR25_09632 [Diploscapter pachys]
MTTTDPCNGMGLCCGCNLPTSTPYDWAQWSSTCSSKDPTLSPGASYTITNTSTMTQCSVAIDCDHDLYTYSFMVLKTTPDSNPICTWALNNPNPPDTTIGFADYFTNLVCDRTTGTYVQQGGTVDGATVLAVICTTNNNG